MEEVDWVDRMDKMDSDKVDKVYEVDRVDKVDVVVRWWTVQWSVIRAMPESIRLFSLVVFP